MSHLPILIQFGEKTAWKRVDNPSKLQTEITVYREDLESDVVFQMAIPEEMKDHVMLVVPK